MEFPFKYIIQRFFYITWNINLINKTYHANI